MARGGGVRGRGRGGARGRGSGGVRGGIGRGRGGGRTNFVPSTIPWQSADTDTDTAPTLLTFDEPTGPRISLPSSPQPVDFLSTFLNEDILGHIVEDQPVTSSCLPV